MALPTLIEKPERDWLFKVTKQLSKQPERDCALLAWFFASGFTPLQLNMLQIKDLVSKSGKLNKSFEVKSKANNSSHTFHLVNKKLVAFTLDYLKWRVKHKVCMGGNSDYMGLMPFDALFISSKSNTGFSIKVKKGKFNDTYSCDALNRHILQLLKQGGVNAPSTLSGRRTFACELNRCGFDTAHIHFLLQNKTLETTVKLLTTDAVDMAQIVKRAF